MKWVQRWEYWLMTPFSTDSVSLGRPAIYGAPSAIVGWGSHMNSVSWGIRTPNPMLGYACPFLIVPSWR